MAWTLDHVGVLGRSAADCARLLAASCGAEAELADEIARPADLEALIGSAVAVLKLDDFPVDEAQKVALRATVANARRLGLEVEEVELEGYDFQEAYRLGVLISGAESMAEHAQMLADHPQGFSEAYRQRMAYGGEQSAAILAAAYRDLAGLAEEARQTLGAYQALLMPSTPTAAFSFEQNQPAAIALFTTLGNAVGLPATAFPVGLDSDGLPLSVQALAWDDETSLGLANALAQPVGAPPAYRG